MQTFPLGDQAQCGSGGAIVLGCRIENESPHTAVLSTFATHTHKLMGKPQIDVNHNVNMYYMQDCT